ncbi:hypothetical protein ACCW76_20555 [Pantoea sp. C8B4]|uniref:hypothetical protein n=1 Tax=Pantoea sp. C8B4 TaxID=3243083 RepID=UPI003ED8C2BF
MKEGYYWLKRGSDEPEIWFYSECQPEGWIKPQHDKPVSLTKLTHDGYRIISKRLREPE